MITDSEGLVSGCVDVLELRSCLVGSKQGYLVGSRQRYSFGDGD